MCRPDILTDKEQTEIQDALDAYADLLEAKAPAEATGISRGQKINALHRYYEARCYREILGDSYQAELTLATDDCLRLMESAPSEPTAP